MNNDYCSNSAEGTAEGKPEGKLRWFQKVGSCARSCAGRCMNPMFITFIILFIIIAFTIYWYYVRPYWYKVIYRKLFYNLKGSNTLISKMAELRKNKILQLQLSLFNIWK